MSYSLYLWHWPVFSLVDYRLYLASPAVRIGLKVVLSAAATALCFFWIENPGRVFLNHPGRRRMAFGFLGGALMIFVPLGIVVRGTNYINAEASDVAKGGVVFNRSGENGSMILMGDSNASMYGNMSRRIAQELGLKLRVISVAAGDPLPHSARQQERLWLDSLAVVEREKPEFLVLVCHWRGKLEDDRGRLAIGIKELKEYAHQVILITQPPELPKSASRESMRNGSRPPFVEDPAERDARMETNAWVKSLQGDNVTVIDIEPLFGTRDGRVFYTDNHGDALYQDGSHLSGIGADLVRPRVLEAMRAVLSVAEKARTRST
jgi:hypothetical protein